MYMKKNNLIKNSRFTGTDSYELKSSGETANVSDDKLKERKKAVKIKISIENLNKCNKMAEDSLDEDEEIIYKFRGLMSGLKYLGSVLSYTFWTNGLGAYSLLNLGTNYIVYITNKRIIFLEVDEINNIKKKYSFVFSDIIKFKYKNKGNDTILDFKYKSSNTDDEINTITTGFFNFAYMLNNRIIMTVTNNKSKEIAEYLSKILCRNY